MACMIDAESFLVLKNHGGSSSLPRETYGDDADERDEINGFSIINLKSSASTDKRLAVLKNRNGSIALVEQPGGHTVQTIAPEWNVTEVCLSYNIGKCMIC